MGYYYYTSSDIFLNIMLTSSGIIFKISTFQVQQKLCAEFSTRERYPTIILKVVDRVLNVVAKNLQDIIVLLGWKQSKWLILTNKTAEINLIIIIYNHTIRFIIL